MIGGRKSTPTAIAALGQGHQVPVATVPQARGTTAGARNHRTRRGFAGAVRQGGKAPQATLAALLVDATTQRINSFCRLLGNPRNADVPFPLPDRRPFLRNDAGGPRIECGGRELPIRWKRGASPATSVAPVRGEKASAARIVILAIRRAKTDREIEAMCRKALAKRTKGDTKGDTGKDFQTTHTPDSRAVGELCVALKRRPASQRKRGWIMEVAREFVQENKGWYTGNAKNLVRQARRYPASFVHATQITGPVPKGTRRGHEGDTKGIRALDSPPASFVCPPATVPA